MFSELIAAIAELVVRALNGLIAALGFVLSGFVSILPDMPELPTLPSEFTTAASWVAWFFPVGTVLDVLLFTITMWLLWQAVAIALRWAKALNA